MKVLIADKFEQSGIDGLKAAGCEVLYLPEVLYVVILIWLFLSGPGWFSVDGLL